MTLAIGHADNGRGILDCLLERPRAVSAPAKLRPSSPRRCDNTVSRSCVATDTPARGRPSSLPSSASHTRRPSNRRAISTATFLPLLNTGIVDLLDHPRMINQLCSLERRTIRGGRDSIDHPPLGHDDLVNAAAGVLVDVAGDRQPAGSRWGMDGLVNR